MTHSLANLTLACALVLLPLSATGCAVDATDPAEQSEADLVTESQSALSGASKPKGVTPLYARATFDRNLGVTMVDVATSQIPAIQTPPDHDPHATPYDDDRFVTVMVYIDRAGRRDVLRVLGKKQIGPGGGCIHFNIVAGVGDRLFIGGVVKLGGGNASVALAAPVTVVAGDWQTDQTVQKHTDGAI